MYTRQHDTVIKSDKIIRFILWVLYLCLKIVYMFSKACEYSIRAAIFIASRSMDGKRANLKEISAAIDSPEAFTAKLLQQLVREGIIESVKGAQGGFEVQKRRISKIKLCDIVNAIDGDDIYKMCGLGLKACSSKNPCPVHYKFMAVRSSLKEMLNDVSLQQLSQGFKEGKTLLALKDIRT